MSKEYMNEVLGPISGLDNTEDFAAQIEHLDKRIHKLRKKCGKGKKRGKKERKKLKAELKEREWEREWERDQLLALLVYQGHFREPATVQPQPSSWMDVLADSLPQALELVTAIVNRSPCKAERTNKRKRKGKNKPWRDLPITTYVPQALPQYQSPLGLPPASSPPLGLPEGKRR